MSEFFGPGQDDVTSLLSPGVKVVLKHALISRPLRGSAGRSVDSKAKGWLGNRDKPGRTWRPGKDPIIWIYDIATNTGWVNVGTDHDTAEFAVESVRRWWQRRGRADHPNATRLLITADAGGSNDPRRWTWKKHLGRLRPRERAGDHGLPHSAWHVEMEQDRTPDVLPHHRQLTGPAADQLPGRHGNHRRDDHPGRLTIGAELDTGSYCLGSTVSAAEFNALPVTPSAFHGDWNYAMTPVSPRAPESPTTIRRIDPTLTTMLSDPALTGHATG